jgi:hypothetical protein
MQQRLWLAFAVVLGVSFAIQVSRPVDLSDRPETTFDTAPRGHAGVFALLDLFEETRGRWLSGLTMPATDETIWWIAPGGACEGTVQDDPADPESEGQPTLLSPFEISVRPWIEAGGTAVVWISRPPMDGLDVQGEDARPLQVAEEGQHGQAEHDAQSTRDSEEADAAALRAEWEESLAEARESIHEGEPVRCRAIAGFALPPRRLAGLEGGAPPIDRRYTPIVFSIGRATERREDFDYDSTRVLPGPTLAFFSPEDASTDVGGDSEREMSGNKIVEAIDDSMAGWRPLWVESDDDTPLALERSIGKGRLVVIADARVLSNGRLGRMDSAPFVFDWVRDYGPPWIDEHAHGVVPEAGTFRYLARSPAWATGLGLLVLGALVVWRGNAWPTRVVQEFDPDSPTLAAYVDSVARLYSGTRDHARVFERYRAVCLDRIRRALGLAPGTGVEIILASLRMRAQNWPALRDSGLGHLLTKTLPIPDADALVRNAARLDDLVRGLREGGRAGKSGNGQNAGRSAGEVGIAGTKGTE